MWPADQPGNPRSLIRLRWSHVGSTASGLSKEGSTRTIVIGWMYRMVWVFAGHTGLIVGFVVRWLYWYFTEPVINTPLSLCRPSHFNRVVNRASTKRRNSSTPFKIQQLLAHWSKSSTFYCKRFQSSRKYACIILTPLNPTFRGVNIIFLIFAQKHRLCVLVRTASVRRF